ncbi:MAG TPA: zf-TFIIB domain-containing protein [Candidatus Binatia bacterium]|nr:zf-TFIIB domain-containing protein [Candidatus Binatia bacterium]
MKCPLDQADLKMTERQGVEIDYCPQCRGVWLDRGEIDKIIDRSMGEKRGGYDDDEYRRGYQPHGYDPRKKRRGFLADLFDFD